MLAMEERPHIHLKLTIRCLAALGFWPLRIQNKLLALLYAAYYYFTITVFIVFVFSQFVEVYVVIGKNLQEFSGLMAINFLYTLGLVKVYVVGGPTVKRLIRKIRITEGNILTSNTLENQNRNHDDDNNEKQEIVKIYKEHVTKNKNANLLMMFLGLMCYFMFCMTPTFVELTSPTTGERFYVLDNKTTVYRERPLPLVSWFPYDAYKYYDFSFSWHALAGCINTSYIVACNNMFFALMTFAVGQIKILQREVSKIQVEHLEEADEGTDYWEIERKLERSIIYHGTIIRFVDELDNAMRSFLLMDFVACALQIAMIGFEIAVGELSFQLLKNIIYMASMVIQLFLFYWHGNEVLLESVKVADAVWESGWYECKPKERKIFLQIMMRAQRPLRLSVGSFYNMSTQTMVTILRSSYSYAAIMRQFYSRKSNN